jgi:hypothetical protein
MIGDFAIACAIIIYSLWEILLFNFAAISSLFRED